MTQLHATGTTLCALLPVHAGANPVHVSATLDSLVAQDRPADEIVVVEDGPLTGSLTAVLDRFEAFRPECRRIRIPTNRGPGGARQAGLEQANSEWIALVDSDDISLPERFSIQLAAVARCDVDMLGGAMLEFDGSPDRVIGRRVMPATPTEIWKYARLRTPVNNSTVMFRRDVATALGGYRNLAANEDYDLVARFLVAGHAVGNLSDVLVLCRSGNGMFQRRRALSTHRDELQLQRNLNRYGLISKARAICNLTVRVSFRLLPPPMMRLAYRLIYLQTAVEQETMRTRVAAP